MFLKDMVRLEGEVGGFDDKNIDQNAQEVFQKSQRPD